MQYLCAILGVVGHELLQLLLETVYIARGVGRHVMKPQTQLLGAGNELIRYQSTRASEATKLTKMTTVDLVQ